MVSLLEYWRELGLSVGAIVTFLAGRRSTKIMEKKQTVEAIDAMQKTYDVFLNHYKKQYDEIIAKLNNLELRNAILTESSQSWEKKFKDLSEKYKKLNEDFEAYKKIHNKKN